MNKDLLNLPEPSVEDQFSKLAEAILKESLLEYRREKLRKEIDRTLKERNRDEFFRLTNELKNIS